MSLFFTTLLTGLALLAAGAALLWNGKVISSVLRTFPRSRRAAYVTVTIAAIWTLYRITQLGEADFGRYRTILFVAFAALAVLSFRYVPDFLAVRGTAALTLLTADAILNSAFMQYQLPQRLFLVSVVYLAIFLALYLAVAPYRTRDFFSWLFATGSRPRLVGMITATYGLVLLIVALTY
ncbi:MAG: hypothetical protein R3F07_00665 [Opitutaceae bacterium]